jgi:hypothetical protein
MDQLLIETLSYKCPGILHSVPLDLACLVCDRKWIFIDF